MESARKITVIPKRTLVDTILNAVNRDLIRQHFSIDVQTNLRSRLESFKKTDLVEFLSSTSEGTKALKDAEQNYPIYSPPTLYVIHVERRLAIKDIVSQTSILASQGRDGGSFLVRSNSVRVVYVDQEAHKFPAGSSDSEVLEIPLLYERRRELTDGEKPDSDNYGERIIFHTLERAFLWIIDGHAHGILCCPDFESVRPIINYIGEKLDLRCNLPNLTEDMMKRLAANASPRSATFSRSEMEQTKSDYPQVRTITISDPILGQQSEFRRLTKDSRRSQTAGYYMGHPGLTLGGLGISRRYGRIWTPARLSHTQLFTLALDLIEQTERQLTQEASSNLPGYIRYFRNRPVYVNNKPLRGFERETFDQLLGSLIRANGNTNRETILQSQFVSNLVQYQSSLRLTTTFDFDCPNCGTMLAKCQDCDGNIPFTATIVENDLVAECPHCQKQIKSEDNLHCDCSAEVNIVSLENHLKIFPSPELIESLRDFSRMLEVSQWQGTFIVSGNLLKMLMARPQQTGKISLSDLSRWRTGARYHLRRNPQAKQREKLIKLLANISEKCPQYHFHPTRGNCDACLAQQISFSSFRDRAICLPRLLGLPIGEDFDGIHHGNELADVRYKDTLEASGTPVDIAIHVKSRVKRTPPNGIGRSKDPIKALYMQIYYSAYAVLSGRIQFDVIGAAIPNSVSVDTIDSMQRILNELGFQFLLIDEDSWLLILDAVLEELNFRTAAVSKRQE